MANPLGFYNTATGQHLSIESVQTDKKLLAREANLLKKSFMENARSARLKIEGFDLDACEGWDADSWVNQLEAIFISKCTQLLHTILCPGNSYAMQKLFTNTSSRQRLSFKKLTELG